MPLNQQAKLLRPIEDGWIMPVGATEPVAVSPRIVSATNAAPHKAVDGGRFREDLFDRLNVLPLGIPPLSERADDARHLAEHFLALANEAEGAEVGPITASALRALTAAIAHRNLRWLRNVIWRIVVVKRKGSIKPADLAEVGVPHDVNPTAQCSAHAEDGGTGQTTLSIEFSAGCSYRDVMAQVERAITDAALQRHDGHVGRAMAALGMGKDVWYRVRRG